MVLLTVAAPLLEMLVTIPNIEFVKGIPTALEQDAYLDVYHMQGKITEC